MPFHWCTHWYSPNIVKYCVHDELGHDCWWDSWFSNPLENGWCCYICGCPSQRSGRLHLQALFLFSPFLLQNKPDKAGRQAAFYCEHVNKRLACTLYIDLYSKGSRWFKDPSEILEWPQYISFLPVGSNCPVDSSKNTATIFQIQLWAENLLWLFFVGS